MDVVKYFLFLTLFIIYGEIYVRFVEANNLTTISVSPARPTGKTQLDVLAAQTANLAAKLIEEIAKREALEKEVQSKNDLTEFLRQDVQILNKTLEQETSKRINIEATLSQVQGVINNVQSTLSEDRDNVGKLSQDLRTLESRLTSEMTSLNQSVEHLQTLIVSNKDGIQNITSNVSELESKLENQTVSIDMLYHLNKQENISIQQKLTEISSGLKTVERKLESQEKAINSTILIIDKFQIDLSNHSSRFNELRRDMSMLNKTTEEFMKQSATQVATLNVSVETIRLSLETVKQAQRNDITDIKGNVTSLNRKIDQYALLTKEYNKTIIALSSQIATPSKAGDSEVYFFASKPRTMLRSNQPPVFTSSKSNTGSTFDSQTSLFTAPISGVYMFTVTLQKDVTETNQDVLCWLKKNGSLLLSIDAHSAFIGSAPSATNTIVIELTKGDRIQLTQCTGTVFISAQSSSFSGVLLHAH